MRKGREADWVPPHPSVLLTWSHGWADPGNEEGQRVGLLVVCRCALRVDC